MTTPNHVAAKVRSQKEQQKAREDLEQTLKERESKRHPKASSSKRSAIERSSSSRRTFTASDTKTASSGRRNSTPKKTGSSTPTRTSSRHDPKVVELNGDAVVQCQGCGYYPKDLADMDRHVKEKVAEKLKARQAAPLSSRPLRDNEQLRALRKKLEKK